MDRFIPAEHAFMIAMLGVVLFYAIEWLVQTESSGKKLPLMDRRVPPRCGLASSPCTISSSATR